MSSLNCPETESDCLRPLRHGTRLFVVSPHLDDAVFGCAGLLARHPGAIVCTVFAGEPRERMKTPWDASCGFADSHVAMRVRWREEERALAICEAQPLRLGFLDAQYGATPAVEAVAEALAAQYERFAAYLPVCPFGLWHSDHKLVGAACRRLLRDGRFAHCIAYEDAIYRAQPGALDEGLQGIEDDGLRATPIDTRRPGAAESRRLAAVKRRAIGAYRSQLRAFKTVPPDAVRPERYWHVERAARGEARGVERQREAAPSPQMSGVPPVTAIVAPEM